ncbi:MAG TPA: MEDS domain-containing protein [Candidatus Thermoplasmatota archaeon]|nr:MEDS domain-containing protein [Candidatus Thermoplasmatota archaeon]
MSAADVPPLTPASYPRGRAEVHPHDHAVFVYERTEELGEGLAHFIREGVARHELSIFVHGFATDNEAWAFVERHLPDVRRLHKDEFVLVSLYREAFEGAATRIDYARVTGVVGSLLDRAQRTGRRGVRIFVDASRHYFDARRDGEWFAFESWLGRRLQASAGLVCAYRHADATRPDLFPEMLRTHAYRFEAPRGA